MYDLLKTATEMCQCNMDVLIVFNYYGIIRSPLAILCLIFNLWIWKSSYRKKNQLAGIAEEVRNNFEFYIYRCRFPYWPLLIQCEK